MKASARCGAQTRNDGTCRAPALRGKTRCRMHGGAWGSGAPFGNGNAIKNGFFTREAVDERQFVRAVLIEAENLLRQLPADSISNRQPMRERNPTHHAGNGLAPSHLTNDTK
ncbi:HGGxSTG domain-containing protein [Bradyrhizobium sp. LB11.1]|uniref:HGGxSTG domain-containing protein n=1 Tax=Bradyrhizobium sp. LB11.1 TaxID=3156326 RepID=UPI003392BC4A